MRPHIALAIASLAAAGAGGCRTPLSARPSGSSATPAARTATATPGVVAPPSALPAGVLAFLRRYAAAPSDLPPGYGAGGFVEVSNQQAANDFADVQAARQEIAETKRQGGLGQQILPPSSVTGTIGLSIEAFDDAAGAQRWASQPPPLPAGLNATPVAEGPIFGDAFSTLHWSQGSQSGYVLSFSRGRVAYGLGIAAPSGQESLAPLQALAQSLEQKARRQSN